MNQAIVKVDGLSHRYAMHWAIKDISFELMNKGVYGLLGANGAGKSTIMNIMCGVLKQSKGEIYVKGINMSTDPVEAKKHIGFLPQKPPLLMDLTVKEYLIYSANVRLMDDKIVGTAVEEAMNKVGISHFANRLIKNLSGGYQQRVGIAQAIIHKPGFVVMDEPTNGLDPNQIMEVRKLIKEIAEERTVILSTHILQEVRALCDNVWMINSGSVVFSGSIDEFDNYITPNILNLTLLGTPAAEELKDIPGVLQVEYTGNNKYKLNYTDAPETIERIVEISVARKWRLTEITTEKVSLDNVFAKLSKKKTSNNVA